MYFRRSARTALLAAAIAVGIQASDAGAQNTGTSQFQAFTKSEFYRGLLNRSLAGLPQTVFQRCPELVSNGSTVTIIKPVTFGADGFPNAGLWKQTFPVSGCGNDTTLHFYFSAGADEKINTVVGVPGTTLTGPTLQRDAYSHASTGAALAVKDCKTFDTKNTKFEGYGLLNLNPPTPDPGANSHDRPWWETWTMVGCGHTVDVPVDFVPDDKGTQVIVPPVVIAAGR